MSQSRFTPSYRGGSGAPLVLLHGFTDSWRTWDLVLPALEKRFDVFAPTLPGHAGGPPLPEPLDGERLLDAVEALLDGAGLDRARICGNSLGGYLALRLAERGRATSVVALAPAGGFAPEGAVEQTTRSYFLTAYDLVRSAAPHAEAIAASPAGRRRATEMITEQYEHIPTDLIAHQIRAAAACDAVHPLIELAATEHYALDLAAVSCPVRIAWGTEDRLLPWPAAAERYRDGSLAHADWVVMDGVGHCPQLDVPAETAELIAGLG